MTHGGLLTPSSEGHDPPSKNFSMVSKKNFLTRQNLFHRLWNMSKIFSTQQLAQKLGITQRRLIDWCERGIILADIKEADGYASRREFSYKGALRAALAISLKEKFKVPREMIKHIVNSLWLRNFFTEWTSGDGGFLVVVNPHDQERMKWFYLPQIFDSNYRAWAWLWKDSEAFLIVDLEKIKQSFDQKI
jgi:hypothetical protein